MRKNFGYWAFSGGLLFCLSCSAQAISSSDLINSAKQYDGQTVVYQGEVIGDVMVRGRFAWVNLNDGKNAIGIWVGKAVAAGIRYAGSYNLAGDFLEVTGIFYRSCPEHGGDLDIHARTVVLIRPGNSKTYLVDKRRVIAAGGVFGLLLVFGLTAKWRRVFERKSGAREGS